MGLAVIDEPSSNQSDPILLNLRLKAIGKQVTSAIYDEDMTIKTVSDPKDIDTWISNIRSLHEATASMSNVMPLINTQLPEIEQLMQEWDPELEEILAERELPSADMDMTIEEYVTIACGELKILSYL